MLFHFQTGNVTFFEEDKDYFQKRFLGLKKLLGSFSADEDTVDVRITIGRNKHHTGERFEATSTITCPNHGKFHAESIDENIKKCADMLHEKLKTQILKFHDRQKGSLGH